MLGRHIGNKLLNQHCFTYARTAKKANLTTFGIGGQQVNDLNSGFQNFYHRALICKSGWIAVNTPLFSLRQRVAAINNITRYIKEPTQSTVAHRHLYSAAFGSHFHVPAQSLTGGKHNAAYGVAAHMLGNLHHAFLFAVLYCQRIFDEGQVTFREQNVHYRALHLCNNTFHHDVFFLFCALAPPATSTIC